MTRTTPLLVSDEALARLRACEGFLLDMDGTLYLDDHPLPGAHELIEILEKNGVPHLFLTNNSSRSGAAYLERLRSIGLPATRDQVFTSGDATILHLLSATPYRRVFLLGPPALQADFEAAGLVLDDKDPDCVVVAFDTTLTYARLQTACTMLFAGKPYFATHPDRTCITRNGLVPDIAAIIAACEAVTRRLPVVVGKPEPIIVSAALRRLGTPAARTAMIGDQLDTDMAMARRTGLVGVLVLSGETPLERVAALPDGDRPLLVAPGVAQVATWLWS